MRLLTLGLLLAPSAFAADDLMSLYQDAINTHPSLQSAQAALDAARFDVDAASSALRPTLSAAANLNGSEVTRSTSSTVAETGSSSVDGALSARIALWGPSEQAAIAAAKAGAALSETSAQSTLNQLQLSIAQRYLDVLNAQAGLSAAQAQTQAIERQLERAQKRLEVGLGTRVEVDQTQAAYDNAQVALIRAQDSLADAREVLATTVNRPVNDIAALSDRYPAARSELTLDQVIEQAQNNSTAVRVAQQQVQLARAALAQAQATEKPRLDATASYSTSKNLEGGLWGNGYSTKLTLSLPIYTGGKAQAQVASAQAKLNQAQADLEAQRRDVKSQARSLYRTIATQAQSVRAQAQSIRSAQSALQATEAAFEVGSGDIIDVLNAQSDLNAAQSNYAQSRHQHALLVLQLEQLRGDLNQEDLVALNANLGD